MRAAPLPAEDDGEHPWDRKGVNPVYEPEEPTEATAMDEDTRARGRAGYGNLLIVFVLVFLLGVIGILVYGLYRQGGRTARSAPSPEAIVLTVAQEKVYLTAMTEYLCPCGSCDLVFIDCHCPTAQQVKLAAREALQRGASGPEVVRLLEVTFRAERLP